ncbi:E3 ubiquitin-protein ligase hrd1 [Hypoxylon texense]
MAKKSAPSVAYCEEVDDEDHIVPGTSPKYARSTAQSSPSKEKPNTSRSRKDSNRRESRSPPTALSDSDITEPPLPSRRDSTKLKMKEDKKRSSLVVKQQRPAARTRNTAPPSSRISDESSYYGVHPQTVATASSSRPRARTRPESFYGQQPQRPPLSTSAFAHQQPQPLPFPPPSYPPSQWMGPPPPPMAHALVHQPTPSPPYADFAPPPRDLASRFRRPQSAMGFHQPSKSHDYEPPSKEKALTRRTSSARKISKEHDDSRRMPPPPRPASTQPNRLVIRPPPQHAATSTSRKSVGFEDGDLDGDSTMYKAVARRDIEYGSGAPPSRPRRRSFDAESTYDVVNNYEIEPASRSRRNSYYAFEDKVRDASRYQDDVAGGTVPPLTAEALRRVKNGGSSRSTRSSASRDESDYKQSATTRTTRSSDGDDDITIKLPIGAVIEVGNTKIHCRDGGDINIGRNNNGASRGGSDHTTNYSDDRKSRVERPVARTRASSQAGSFSRTRPAPPMYAPPNSYYDDHYGPRYAPPGILDYPADYTTDDDEYSIA